MMVMILTGMMALTQVSEPASTQKEDVARIPGQFVAQGFFLRVQRDHVCLSGERVNYSEMHKKDTNVTPSA